ncbi:TraM recognition domain-containing protein [Streptomyces turgidiscabies]|uniref:type IV secretory system conjugative DNA transfer family protein n=1 Tax=Streptomyces turgidiscabies TaxID=85558 RepID=UPI0038F6F8FC
MNDQINTQTPIDSTNSTAVTAPPVPADALPDAPGEQENESTWDLRGPALTGLLFSQPRTFTGPTVRYTALAVPATFLAAETTTTDPSAGDLLSRLLGGLAHSSSQLFESQPLLMSAMVVGLVGAGYMKLRGDFDFAGETDGFATRRALRKAMGRDQLVKRRKVLRPSLADVPNRKVPTNAVGVYVGRDRKTGLHLYMAIEDSSITVAPMGAGKTAKIANWIIDAEGAALVTSTKYEIVELTERLRRKVGRILLWNPQGLAGRASNVAWDPVIGCADPREGIDRAMRRARYLLEGSDATKGVENRSFWQTASYRVLKAFLWAADADGRTLLDVARWSKQPRNHEAIEIFEKFEQPDPYNPMGPVAPRGWKDDLEQAQKVEGKMTTTENVFGTLAQTFMFLDSPRVQEIIETAHDKDAPHFDIPAYLESQDTLYLIGRDEGLGGVGPLFTCLVGEIYETARDMASHKRGGRLDPPWSLILDEAALICAVPLPQWTADSRGLGISVAAIFQSIAQIYERWGKFGAQTIWDNCTKLIMGGLSNQEHLDAISALCGKHMEKRESRSSSPGQDGTMRESVSYTKVEVPTMPPADILNLETGEILVLRKHLGGPAVVRFEPVWARKDIKALEKADKKATETALKGRLRKRTATDTVTAVPTPVAPPVTAGAPSPANPWAPTAPGPDTSPWTAAPAASGWAPGPFAGPVDDHKLVVGEVIPPTAPVPPRPDYDPTNYLEQVPLQPQPVQDQAQPTQLRKTGTDGGPTGPQRPTRNTDDDDLGVL